MTHQTLKQRAEIPPYQSVDIWLGHHENPIPPVRGYAVCFAYDRQGILIEEDVEPTEYPDGQVFKAWIHTEEGRKSWTPR